MALQDHLKDQLRAEEDVEASASGGRFALAFRFWIFLGSFSLGVFLGFFLGISLGLFRWDFSWDFSLGFFLGFSLGFFLCFSFGF